MKCLHIYGIIFSLLIYEVVHSSSIVIHLIMLYLTCLQWIVTAVCSESVPPLGVVNWLMQLLVVNPQQRTEQLSQTTDFGMPVYTALFSRTQRFCFYIFASWTLTLVSAVPPAEACFWCSSWLLCRLDTWHIHHTFFSVCLWNACLAQGRVLCSWAADEDLIRR